MKKNKNMIYVATSHQESIAGSYIIVGRNEAEFEERFLEALMNECVDTEETLDFVKSFEFYVYDLVTNKSAPIADPSIIPIKWDVEFNYPEL